MKALVKSKKNVGLWLEEVPDPDIGINDVLIRIKKTGICGSTSAKTFDKARRPEYVGPTFPS